MRKQDKAQKYGNTTTWKNKQNKNGHQRAMKMALKRAVGFKFKTTMGRIN